jgi:hypothetical protein
MLAAKLIVQQSGCGQTDTHRDQQPGAGSHMQEEAPHGFEGASAQGGLHNVTSMATTTSAIAAVASQPRTRRRGPITFAPMVPVREASSIMTAMIGTAITPLITAD